MPGSHELYQPDSVVRKHAQALLASGDVKEALALLSSSGDTPTFLWDDVGELLKKGENEAVEQFIDGVKDEFPDYYLKCGSEAVNSTPMVGILTYTNRDLFLVYALKSALDEDDAEALFTLAYTFGRAEAGDRLATIVDPLDLDKLRSQQVTAAYRVGMEAAQEPPANPES